MRGTGPVPLLRRTPGKVTSKGGNRRSGVLLWPFQGWDSKGRGNRNPLPLAALFPHFGAAAKMGSRSQARNLPEMWGLFHALGREVLLSSATKVPKNAAGDPGPRSLLARCGAGACRFRVPRDHGSWLLVASKSYAACVLDPLPLRCRSRAVVQAVLFLSSGGQSRPPLRGWR